MWVNHVHMLSRIPCAGYRCDVQERNSVRRRCPVVSRIPAQLLSRFKATASLLLKDIPILEPMALSLFGMTAGGQEVKDFVFVEAVHLIEKMPLLAWVPEENMFPAHRRRVLWCVVCPAPRHRCRSGCPAVQVKVNDARCSPPSAKSTFSGAWQNTLHIQSP